MHSRAVNLLDSRFVTLLFLCQPVVYTLFHVYSSALPYDLSKFSEVIETKLGKLGELSAPNKSALDDEYGGLKWSSGSSVADHRCSHLPMLMRRRLLRALKLALT